MATVLLTCKGCGSVFEVGYKLRAKRQFCSRNCADKSHTGAGNPAYGRTYRTKATHPEWAAKVSATSSARQINAGEKNAMKRVDVAARASATRSHRFATEPEFRAQVSAYTRKAWAAGKFDGVAVGRCKWYDHVRPDGSIIKLQGTWEVALARRLDALGLEYLAHEGRWPYVDSDGRARSYYPDFHIPMWNVTIDVKGVYWDACGAEKFERIRASNCDAMLVVATRDVLESWGVDIASTQKELLT